MFVVVTLALIGLAAGGMAGGALADATANHRGDIGAIFIGLLAGAALGAAGGGALGWRIRQKFADDPRKPKSVAAGVLLSVFVVFVGVAMIGQVREGVRNPDLIRPDGGGLSLIYELRLPPGTTLPVGGNRFAIELRAPEETKLADSARVRQEADRVMIQGHFWVTKAAPKRIVAVRIGDGPAALFTMRLAARPADRGGRWSAWQRPDADGDKTAGGSPPDEAIEIRYAANY